MTRPRALRGVHVVVPAKDEQELLPRCLDALEGAVERVRTERPELAVSVTVVLDACTDASEGVVLGRPGVLREKVAAACVGAARAHGLRAVLSRTKAADLAATWIANTDADSVVPDHWLVRHAEAADSGLDLLVGSVEPDPDDLDAGELIAWWARHTIPEGHDHVHGANLGFRLDAYLRVGGFEPIPAHEDVRLVQAMRRAGLRWRATTQTQVRTSGRRWGRTEAGFAAYVRALPTTG